MIYLYGLIIMAFGSFLWRVRGGLRFNGEQLPMNKIWFALAVGLAYCYHKDWSINAFVMGSYAMYLGYQLFGWGKYISALVAGVLNKEEKECELIDDLLDNCKITVFGKKYMLIDYTVLYGFASTTLTGLIVTTPIGLVFNSNYIVLSGLGMGVCYGLATLICKILKKDEGKNSWNFGEWIFGAYLGYIIASIIL